MDDELIQLKEVTKRFGKNVVLDSVSFTIPENKIMGIIGASGEGKTTILKIIIGFLKPNSGKVTYLRRDILKEMKDVKKNFGFATEDGSFYNDLTIKENLFHYGKLYGMKNSEIKKRTEELAELVELNHALDTLAGNISMGMKKRLDVAISMIHNPSVLIMDEPTADLDPLLRNQMMDLIKKIKNLGTTVIITTQLLGEMDKICDKIAILYNAKIVEEGHPGKIKNKYNEKDLDGVFNKIFSGRKRFKKESIKKDKEIEIEIPQDKNSSDYYLDEINKGKKDD